MPSQDSNTLPSHVTVAVVLQVRDGQLQVLLWQRAREPFAGAWSLPGGRLRHGETLADSIRAHLATKVDVRELAWLEQLETLSEPDRHPDEWQLATAYLGWCRATSIRRCRPTRAGCPVDELPERDRLRPRRRSCSPAASGCAPSSRTRTSASRSRPETFTISELRDLYTAALGYRVSATNLQRVLERRGLLEPTGDRRSPGPDGGRPAAVFRFRSREMEVTDPFAVLRPPGSYGGREARRLGPPIPCRSPLRPAADALAAERHGDADESHVSCRNGNR